MKIRIPRLATKSADQGFVTGALVALALALAVAPGAGYGPGQSDDCEL